MTSKQTDFIAGLDLGQVNDYSALTIFERFNKAEPVQYQLRYLDRFKRGMSYPDQIDRVVKIINRSPLRDNCTLIIDGTGVGRPVVDMFREARIPVPIKAITITGGNSVSEGETKNDYRVPKRDLVSALQVLLQSKRLKIAENVKHAETLVEELMNFKVSIGVSGHDSYEAWREGTHDDLVLSAAMACWYGEQGYSEGTTVIHSISTPESQAFQRMLEGF